MLIYCIDKLTINRYPNIEIDIFSCRGYEAGHVAPCRLEVIQSRWWVTLAYTPG